MDIEQTLTPQNMAQFYRGSIFWHIFLWNARFHGVASYHHFQGIYYKGIDKVPQNETQKESEPSHKEIHRIFYSWASTPEILHADHIDENH